MYRTITVEVFVELRDRFVARRQFAGRTDGEICAYLIKMIKTRLRGVAHKRIGVQDAREHPWPTHRDPETGREQPVEFADHRTSRVELEIEVRDAIEKFIRKLA